MTIDIYSKYKVKIHSEWNYISTEDSEPGDIVFKKDKYEKEHILCGGELLNIIGKDLLNDDTSDFLIKDNKIIIESFIPSSGEGGTTRMEIERIEEDREMIKANVLISTDGKNFHCRCGANVFTKYSDGIYKCNLCGLEYKGE